MLRLSLNKMFCLMIHSTHFMPSDIKYLSDSERRNPLPTLLGLLFWIISKRQNGSYHSLLHQWCSTRWKKKIYGSTMSLSLNKERITNEICYYSYYNSRVLYEPNMHISCSTQCSTTCVTKTVLYLILSVG